MTTMITTTTPSGVIDIFESQLSVMTELVTLSILGCGRYWYLKLLSNTCRGCELCSRKGVVVKARLVYECPILCPNGHRL